MAKSISLAAGSHQVEVRTKGGKYFVDIDGAPSNEYKLSKTSYWTGVNEDFSLYIDDKLYILALRGKKMRLAADGRYLDDDSEYKPAVPLPGWTWVFVILNVLIPVLSLGGATNVLLAFVGIFGCAAVARNEKIGNSVAKLGLCLLITIVVWIVWILLVVGLATLTA